MCDLVIRLGTRDSAKYQVNWSKSTQLLSFCHVVLHTENRIENRIENFINVSEPYGLGTTPY